MGMADLQKKTCCLNVNFSQLGLNLPGIVAFTGKDGR